MKVTLETLQAEFDYLTKELKRMMPLDSEYQALWDRRTGVRRRIVELRKEHEKNDA